MARHCYCDICDVHRKSGSPWYTSKTSFRELSDLQQRIQLERHAARGVCPHWGPPFERGELSPFQWAKYAFLWDPAWEPA